MSFGGLPGDMIRLDGAGCWGPRSCEGALWLAVACFGDVESAWKVSYELSAGEAVTSGARCVVWCET